MSTPGEWIPGWGRGSVDLLESVYIDTEVTYKRIANSLHSKKAYQYNVITNNNYLTSKMYLNLEEKEEKEEYTLHQLL